MSKRFEVLGKRYNELRIQGITCKEAVKIINRESNTNIAEVTIRSYGAQYKKKFGEVESRSEQEEHNSHETGGEPEPILSERQEDNVQHPSHGQDKLDERIRQIAREVFEEMGHHVLTERNIIDEPKDEPPEPEFLKETGKGRTSTRDYEKVSVTVDKELWRRFVAEKNRLRVSTGRLLDIILWRHYGRPELTFKATRKGKRTAKATERIEE